MRIRDFVITLPDRIKLLRYRLHRRLHLIIISLIDRYLDRIGERRVSQLIAVEEMPVMFSDVDLEFDIFAVDWRDYSVYWEIQ